MKNTYLIIFFFAFISFIALNACNKISPVGNGPTGMFIKEDTVLNARQVKISGTDTAAIATLTPVLTFPTNQSSGLSASVDPTLVNSYNKQTGKNYVLLPAAYYKILNNITTVPVGSITADPIRISFTDGIDTLSSDTLYVLPVVAASVSGAPLLNSSKVTYYVIDNSILVSSAASLTNNYFTPSFTGANVSKLSGLSSFTYEGLVYINSYPSSTADAGISTFMGTEGYLLARFGDAGLQPGQLELANAIKNVVSPTQLSLKQWHHIAITYDGTTVRIYYDSVLAVQQIVAITNINFTTKTNGGADQFRIGRSYDATRYLDGYVAECRVWSVARSLSDLNKYQYRIDPHTPGLLAYWKFNEGSGNNAADATGNGFDAAANSSVQWNNNVQLPGAQQ